MTFTAAHVDVAYQSYLDWIVLGVAVHDDDPDGIIRLTPMLGPGRFAPYYYSVKTDRPYRIARRIAGSQLNLIGQKIDLSAVYIALSVDLNNDALLEIYAVDESGASGGGGGDGDLPSHIAGTTKIDGAAASRLVLVIKDDPAGREVVAEGVSATDGTFDISYGDWDGAVIALALDHYGQAFAAETPINSGTIVHPTTPNGYVYEASVAGTTGITEPVWLADSSVQSGSVTFYPRPYYRPVASGPLQGEIIEDSPAP